MNQKRKKRPTPAILGGKRHKRREAFIDLDRYYADENMYNAIIYGPPRCGKTVLLANFLNIYQGMGLNCWINDVAKGFSIKTKKPRSEILMFFSEDLEFIKGVRIFVPKDCQVKIPTREYEQIQVTSFDDLFENLRKDRLNIICLESFILHPTALARFWALFSIELLIRAKQYQLELPVFGGLDQINNIFPSIGHGFSGAASQAQTKASNWFSRFLRDSSGCGVKIAATSHQITAVKKNVRHGFQWNFFKNVTEDVRVAVPRIGSAQNLIQTLPIDCVYATDDQNWGDTVVDIPNVTYPPDSVHYLGGFIKDERWLLDSKYQEWVLTEREKRERKKARQVEEKIRFTVVILYLSGWTYSEISYELNISEGSIANILNEWRNGDYSEDFLRLEHWARYKGQAIIQPPQSIQTGDA